MANKTKIGRPLEGPDARTVTVGVRVSPKEKRRIERAAKRRGRKVGAYLRDLALAAE